MTEWLRVAVDVLQFALALGAAAFAWVRTRDASNKRELDALADQIGVEREERRRADEAERERRSRGQGELKDRMTSVEEKVKHLPTLEHHADLHRDLTKLEGRVESMAAALDGVRASATRIEDYLIKKADQ